MIENSGFSERDGGVPLELTDEDKEFLEFFGAGSEASFDAQAEIKAAYEHHPELGSYEPPNFSDDAFPE